MKKRNVVLIVLFALAGVYSVYSKVPDTGRGTSSAEVQVTASPVVRQKLVRSLEALGTARANESVDITAIVSETVDALHFDDGHEVKKGTVLVELSKEEEEAELSIAKAGLEEQERELKRAEELIKKSAIPESDLDSRRTAALTAKHRVEIAQAQLDNRIIKAPFDGVLGLRRVSVGALVEPGDIIATLDDISVMKVDFTVPETFVSSVSKDMPIEARSYAYDNNVFKGVVFNVDSRVDPVTRAVVVRALIPNHDRLLKPGMLMEITLVKEQKDALVVPEEALIQEQEEHFVFVVDENQTAQKRKVEIGLRQPGVAEVLSGLKEGERVILHGALKIRGGSKVKVAENFVQNSAGF